MENTNEPTPIYRIVDEPTPTESEEYVPSRFRRSNVDRFVPILKRMLNGDKVIRFKHDTIGLNANTAKARVGDAVLAVSRGIQFYEDIDADKLREAWTNYKLDYNQISREILVIRFRETPTAFAANIADVTVFVQIPDFDQILTALARLYGTSILVGRVTIVGMLDDQLRQTLELKFNVSFQQIKPNEHIMSK